MIKLEYVPPYKEMFEYYGLPNPDGSRNMEPGWKAEYTSLYKLPYSVRGCWNGQLFRYLRFHNLVGPTIVDAMRQFAADVPPAEVMKYNELGDALNIRKMKADDYWSTHCVAAIDFNPTLVCWNCDPSKQHPALIQAFADRGFIWGGEWPEPRRDGMHWQAVGP